MAGLHGAREAQARLDDLAHDLFIRVGQRLPGDALVQRCKILGLDLDDLPRVDGSPGLAPVHHEEEGVRLPAEAGEGLFQAPAGSLVDDEDTAVDEPGSAQEALRLGDDGAGLGVGVFDAEEV
jgi:hypothetical protein